MDSSSIVLLLRVLLSLAVVLGLMWFLGRRLAGGRAVARARATTISVVAKQSLGGRSGVAVVEVAGRRLLLGTGEHGVSLLTELDPAPEPEPEPTDRTEIDPAALERLLEPAPLTPTSDDGASSALTSLSTPAARMPAVPMPRHPLDGSILAPSTWRRAVVAVQERTIRR